MSARPLSSVIASIGLVAMLAACGSAPEPADNADAAPIETNVAVSNGAGDPVTNISNAAAPEAAAPAAVNAAAPAPAATPSPAPSPSPVAAAAGPAGDAANGAKLFAQCRLCHSVEPDRNGLGPSLHGVVGRAAGAVAGFNYSAPLKASGLVWDDATLSDYLRSPMRKVPGTRMAYVGMANDQNRADLIAYLETLK